MCLVVRSGSKIFIYIEKNYLPGTQASLQVLEQNGATIWWAGKQFQEGKKLQDYIGNYHFV